MTENNTVADYFREKADEARQKARKSKGARTRKKWKVIADYLDQVAKDAEIAATGTPLPRK